MEALVGIQLGLRLRIDHGTLWVPDVDWKGPSSGHVVVTKIVGHRAASHDKEKMNFQRGHDHNRDNIMVCLLEFCFSLFCSLSCLVICLVLFYDDTLL